MQNSSFARKNFIFPSHEDVLSPKHAYSLYTVTGISFGNNFVTLIYATNLHFYNTCLGSIASINTGTSDTQTSNFV